MDEGSFGEEGERMENRNGGTGKFPHGAVEDAGSKLRSAIKPEGLNN